MAGDDELIAITKLRDGKAPVVGNSGKATVTIAELERARQQQQELVPLTSPLTYKRPTERAGDWMQTFTGRQFWPMDPRPEDLDILDIAHALSLLCRFGGHCQRFYSVAEHSVHVSTLATAPPCVMGPAT